MVGPGRTVMSITLRSSPKGAMTPNPFRFALAWLYGLLCDDPLPEVEERVDERVVAAGVPIEKRYEVPEIAVDQTV